MKKLKVAVLGYGFSGKTLHSPLIQAVEGFELIHVVSSNEAKVKTDLPEAGVLKTENEVFLNPEIDLVVIATPNDLHFESAKKALEHGKHVVVDKPFTTTSIEASELISIAKTHKRILSVFHNRRWDADFLTVKKLIEQKTLGEILQFESHFDRYKPEVKDRWKEQASRGGGLWNDLGSHLVDQVLHLFGMPEGVQSDIGVQRVGGAGDDYFHVSLRYGKLRAILHSTSFAAAETPRFVIHGTKGSFVKYGLDTQELSLRSSILPTSYGFGLDKRDGILTVIEDGLEVRTQILSEIGNYLAYYQGVKNSILGLGPNPVPSEEVLQVMEVLENASRSV